MLSWSFTIFKSIFIWAGIVDGRRGAGKGACGIFMDPANPLNIEDIDDMFISGNGKDIDLGIATLDIDNNPNLRSLAFIISFPPNKDLRSDMLIWSIFLFNGVRAELNACFIKGFSNSGKLNGSFLMQHDAKGSNEKDISDN